MNATRDERLTRHRGGRRVLEAGGLIGLLAVLSLFAMLSAAQADQMPIRFTRLTSAGGLSQNTVAQMLQDRGGYIWLATGDGLNRYDGYEVITHRHDPANPDSLIDNYLRGLAEDRDGMLWVGTAGAGLDRFDPRTGRAVHFRHDPTDPGSLPSDKDVKALTFDRDGALWVGTANGLARLALGAGRFERIALDDVDDQGGRLMAIQTIHHGASGAVYVGTAKSGAYVGTMTDRRFTKLPVDPSSIGVDSDLTVNAIQEGADGTVWLATENAGLIRVRRSGNRIESVAYRNDLSSPTPLPDNEVTAILPGLDGRLWLGTWNAGLLDFDPATGRWTAHDNSLADPRSLSGNTVISLMRDAGGMIWVGTYDRGANRSPTTERFAHYYRDPLREPALPDNTVWAFAETDTGQVWTATAGGLGLFSPAEGRFVSFVPPAGADAALLKKDVRALAAVGDTLWIGTWGNGLLRWNRSAGTLTRFHARSDDAAPLSNDRVRLILPGRDGRLWVGTQAGLNRLDPATGHVERFRHVPNDPSSLPHDRIRALHEGRGGTLWVGTSGGISRRNADGTFTTWTVRTSAPGTLNDDDIRAIHEGADGTLWLATGNGLTRFDPASGPVRTFDERHGFRNATLYGILPDGQGQLWISSNFGLSRFDPTTGTVRTFTAHDGLQDNEFNFGAYRKLRDGSLLFGGINGFNRFRPDEAMAPLPASAAPALAVQNLSVLSDDGAATVHPGDGRPVHLTHRDTVLSIRFAALHYDNPAATGYSTFLEGLDTLWSAVRTDAREVRFTELPSGNYVFRVRAVSARGVPSRNEIAIPLIVHPAPWRTGWAYAGYGLAILLAGAGAHVARTRLLARDAARLRREVDQQTRELAERAHEIAGKNAELRDLLAFRSGLYRTLSHELRTPLTVVLSALQAMAAQSGGSAMAQAIDAGLSSARRLNRLVDQLLLLARTDRTPEPQPTFEVTDATVVIRSLLPAFGVLAASRSVTLTEDLAEGCLLRVPAEAVELIVQNLVSNALKYTPEGGRVRLSVGRVEDTVTVTVADTGIGIPEEHRVAIFQEFFRVPEVAVEREGGAGLGLALVRELATRHGGRIVVDSQPGQGSRFTVSFPLALPPSDGPAAIVAGAAPGPVTPPGPATTGESSESNVLGSLVIIEDDPELVEWLPRLFGSEFTCQVATSADAGLEAVRAIMPDVVLCDVMLRPDPGDRGGFDVAEAIRSDLATSHISIVLLTALDDGDNRLAGLRCEVDDYIAKPFDNEELRTRVRNLIANRRRTREQVRRMLIDTADVAVSRSEGPPTEELLAGLPLDETSRRFLTTLERHVASGINDDEAVLPEIAAKLNIGERQLQRRIKDTCGLSFSEFRTTVRMRDARRLLVTEKTVTEIAHELGYSSAAYFSQVFKRTHDMTPSEWRRRPPRSPADEGIEIDIASPGCQRQCDITGTPWPS